jgi:hypothetical protein
MDASILRSALIGSQSIKLIFLSQIHCDKNGKGEISHNYFARLGKKMVQAKPITNK